MNLAPLQRVMLRDTLVAPSAGQHVEQVEISFNKGVEHERIIRAWHETVALTEVLRIGFVIEQGDPVGWEWLTGGEIFETMEPLSEPWEAWLERDRRCSLLAAEKVPWRVKYWAGERSFLWTLHHALLDGRSLTRVVQTFLQQLDGGQAEEWRLSRWQPPSDLVISTATEMFRQTFAGHEEPQTAGPLECQMDSVAECVLGVDFAQHLAVIAGKAEVSAATLVIWAWGQALLQASGSKSVVVEQVRAGAPQAGTAGFTMNLLPVLIRSGGAASLRQLRAQLLDLRRIESVSEQDFPPGVFPNVCAPWSSVIMVEHTAFSEAADCTAWVKSRSLHESRGESLTASAQLMPDCRLQVEGPGRSALLDGWLAVLKRLDHLLHEDS
jgi:hypothetical protein